MNLQGNIIIRPIPAVIVALGIGIGMGMGSTDAFGADTDEADGWRTSITYSNSRFSRSARKDWHEESIILSRKIDDRTSINLTLDNARRFATNDNSLGGGISHKFNDDVYGNFSFYLTPGADFLARWFVQADAGMKVWDGVGVLGPTVVTINLQHKDYATGDTDNIDPGFVQYMSKIPVWISGKWINSFARKPEKRTAGYSLKVDWQATENLRPFVGYASAPESDEGTVTNVTTKSGGLVYSFNDKTSVRLDYTAEDRKGSYLRNIYSLGLSRQF